MNAIADVPSGTGPFFGGKTLFARKRWPKTWTCPLGDPATNERTPVGRPIVRTATNSVSTHPTRIPPCCAIRGRRFISSMETSLHRDLKALYADANAQFEVPLGNYRIDVVTGGRLVEIQHGSLAAIRDKVRSLLGRHEVVVVKPIVRSKLLVKRTAQGRPGDRAADEPEARHAADAVRRAGPFHPRVPAPAADAGSAAGRHRGVALPGPRPTPTLAGERLPGRRIRSSWPFTKRTASARLPTWCSCSAARCNEPFHTGHLAESLAGRSLDRPADRVLLRPDGGDSPGGQTGQRATLRVDPLGYRPKIGLRVGRRNWNGLGAFRTLCCLWVARRAFRR